MTRLMPEETLLVGKWVEDSAGIRGDSTCERIAELTELMLTQLGSDPSGWDTIYRDPSDDRLWEKIYSESELSGGGPPSLKFISFDDARRKYSNLKF